MKRWFHGCEKGTTDQMLILMVAVVMALVLLIIFFFYAQKESGSGSMSVGIAKVVCGALTPFGIGKAICNL